MNLLENFNNHSKINEKFLNKTLCCASKVGGRALQKMQDIWNEAKIINQFWQFQQEEENCEIIGYKVKSFNQIKEFGLFKAVRIEKCNWKIYLESVGVAFCYIKSSR